MKFEKIPWGVRVSVRRECAGGQVPKPPYLRKIASFFENASFDRP